MMNRHEKWCFIHDGKKYAFFTEREAKVEVFRLTGKMGSIPIYRYIPSAAAIRREERQQTIVMSLFGAVLGLFILGLFIGSGLADFFIYAFGAFGTMLAVLVLAWLALVLMDFILSLRGRG